VQLIGLSNKARKRRGFEGIWGNGKARPVAGGQATSAEDSPERTVDVVEKRAHYIPIEFYEIYDRDDKIWIKVMC
jgi:hypothetical protein